MRTTLFILLAVLLMVSPAVAQENKTKEQSSTSSTETEKPKNEVDLMLEDAKKRGETILTVCAVEDCGGSDKKIENDVVNGRALSLPKPAYPMLARKVHAQGAVRVQIIIGEDGTVVAAAAIDGHPLLFGVSVAAAREATFTPTQFNGKPAKVVGVIVYNFVAM